MQNLRFTLGTLLVAVVLFTGCQSDSQVVGPTLETDGAAVTASSVFDAFAKVGRTQVWADGELFASVVTPTSLKGDKGPFDKLYAGAMFKDGIGLISEAKPGDQDYNGGRWRPQP